MGGLVKFPGKTYTQRIGNDSIYGMGADGNVVISSNTSLSKDMYYNNLTINPGVHLNTNGFRVFVRGTLTLNGSIGVKSDTTVSSGTAGVGGGQGTSVTYSIGGSGHGTTATQIPASLLNNIQSAIYGRLPDISGVLIPVTGGSGGTRGTDGTLTPGTDSPATWPNSAGQAGALGQYPPNAHLEAHDGGRGSHGTPGTRGALASPGTAGIGGSGGAGGPVVLIAAKNVSGSGTVFSQGIAGGNRTLKTEPGAMHGGSAGSTGSNAPAKSAPDVGVYAYHHTRPAHHGGGDTHTTPLPSTWFPYTNAHSGGYPSNPSAITYSWHQSQRYVINHHTSYSIGGEPFHHVGTHGDTGVIDNYHAPVGEFYYIGLVDHNHTATPATTGGAPAGAYAYLGFWDTHYHHAPYTTYNSDYTSHHSAPRAHDKDMYRNAGPVLHSFHYGLSYPGGAGGAAGAAGPAGTAGSTTDGSDGNPGGGGGVIFITEETPLISINTDGATSNSNTASAGMQVILLNK